MELKPCPFCGGAADIEDIGLMYSSWRVGCKNSWCCGSWANHDYVTEFAAAEAWNTRAERTCHDVLGDVEPFECSECHRRINDMKYPNYCWYCGAKVVER